MAKLSVDSGKCIKAGECYYNHPELFKVGKDGFPIVLVEDVDAAQRDAAESAVEGCPAGAISLDD